MALERGENVSDGEISTTPTHYRLEISLNSSFENIIHTSPNINHPTVEYILPSNSALSVNTQHHWRVIAVNATGESTDNPSHSFTTGTNVPLPITALNSPANNAINQIITPRLTWVLPTNSPARTGIYVYIGTTNPPYNPANPNSNRVATLEAHATLWDVSPALNPETQYFWQIVPYNDVGLAIGGTVWRFTTQNEPPLPVTTLISPANNATNQLVTPRLTWTLPSNTPARTGIYVYIGTTNPPYDPENQTNNKVAALDANATSWNVLPALARGTQYFWQIVPYNDTGLATGGTVWNFTTFLPPSFYISPKYHDFLDVKVGEISEQQIFTITNEGGADLELLEIRIEGTDHEEFHRIGPSAMTIPAGSTQIFSIRMRPTSPGAKSANIRIIHRAAGSPDFVTLTGNATVSEADILAGISKTELFSNHPNPFNPETIILFALKTEEYVLIEIFNTKGQRINTLVNSFTRAGIHQVVWDGRDENGSPVSSGIYFYRMQAGEYTETRRMVLMK